ncbi:MAG: FIST C-terminal domain-containing protein [Desulfovibrio sp.]|jgi:hypothetical protein|nr:FIST C-terminal domain-containing protein [Desulfovibrio sp.]
MLAMHTAFTREVDEVDAALGELIDQINPGRLEKNSVGLLNCHSDFLEEGIAGALCKKLPFDIVGMTTMATANQNHFDMYGLCLTVLTSDTGVFETAVTGPLTAGNYRRTIEEAYTRTRGRLPGDPAFIIAYFPTLNDVGGASMLRAFDSACGGIPIWGGLTAGVDMRYEKSLVFRNGEETSPNTLVMALVYGPVEPEFVVTSIPKQNIGDSKGLITASNGCILREVNGAPVLNYLGDLGIAVRSEDAAALPLMPLMLDYGDGSGPVALSIVLLREDGSALCSGEMPQGGTIALGAITKESILDTTGASLEKILSRKRNGLLLLPCVSRYTMLAPNQTDEIKLIAETTAGRIPYMLGYCGGEVCPVRDKNGTYHNRFHNYTFSACMV